MSYKNLIEEDGSLIEENRPHTGPPHSWLDSTSVSESTIEVPHNDSLASSNDGFQPFSYKVKPPNKRFMWIWPKSWDDALWTFDGTLIRWTQKIDGKIAKYISLLFTGMVALEIIIAAPLALLMIGFDSLSIQIGYLALVLATLSQIPKRFIWRYRPYMIYRAQERKRDKTSSFPSRGVTSAVVFSYIVVIVTEHFTSMSIEWWTVLLTVGLTGLVSYARVQLGVHYPSDCVGGVLMGIITCSVGWSLYQLDKSGCGSCGKARQCYATDENKIISMHSMQNANYLIMAVGFVVSMVVGTLFIIKPIQFWKKFAGVFGMILPSLLFHYSFTCVDSPISHGALAVPPAAPWYSYLIGCVLAGAAVVLGFTKFIKKRPLVSFIVYWIFLFGVLIFWRIVLVQLVADKRN